MIKKLSCFLFALIGVFYLNAQLQSGDFETWHMHYGWEAPVGWDCASVSSSTGACDKIVEADGNKLVRVHNVMPCALANGTEDFRTEGYLRTMFLPQFSNFTLSYELEVDSVEAPAEIILKVRGLNEGQLADSLLEWRWNSIVDTVLIHPIYTATEYENIFIEFLAKGLPNEDASSSCNRGYISARIDNVVIDEIVSTEEADISDFLIYPNPFSARLNFESSGEPIRNIQVFDLLGKLVLNMEIASLSSQSIELNQINAGVYLCVLQLGNTLQTARIIKQ